ncbi:shufflon system plasmid conjugative transfer pilus tip adhesin PilV, partial [Burkholderia sp. WAC0059]
VDTYADLPSPSSTPPPEAGDVAVTMDTGRAFVWTGGTWQALAVDQYGRIDLGNNQTVGAACTADSASETLVATDSSGQVLSCQNGTWQTQSEIEPAGLNDATDCQVVLPSSQDEGSVGDYPLGACQLANGADIVPAAGVGGTTTYYDDYNVTLTKPGVIAVSSWAALADGVCEANGAAQPDNEAQVIQYVVIANGAVSEPSYLSYPSVTSQSPTLVHDSTVINNTLNLAEPAGVYTVSVQTGYATYLTADNTTGFPNPWTPSYCNASGTSEYKTPVAAGRTISVYY